MTVFLNMLILTGAREGNIEQLEFPTVDDAVTFAFQTRGEAGFVVEDIEGADGTTLVTEKALRERLKQLTG